MYTEILKRITNTKTLIGIASMVVLLCDTWGLRIPSDQIMVTVRVVCAVGIALGVLNDTGMDTPTWNK